MFPHKLAVLNEHCRAIGRGPNEIRRSVQVFVKPDDLRSTTESVQQFVDAGATHLILVVLPPYTDQIPTRLAEEVVLKIRE